MSKHKGPTEAGSGGKLGHRSMDHRSYNAEIKNAAKKKRRLQERPDIDNQLNESTTDKEMRHAE
ncbi:hypothetical protein [Woeseia oceani]|uniref:Uncharacterized protein n=1 Tax=Woeseia oceani TaxID=1548547 RepID=A0A193LJM3_9GAMM|nr:hypothetical protein [Woeseia oceani]ANO52740.1 hypothetical protein BA177_17460 [Woeseia oceani]